LLLCEPEADVDPGPVAAAATAIPADARNPPCSGLQPSVSKSGQSTGNACATISFVEFADDATAVAGLVCAPAIAA
jgi:hypothetical protein